MQSNMLRGIRSILAQSSGVHDGKRDSCFRLKRRKFSYGNLFSRKRPANADSRCDLLQNLGMLSLPLHGLALRESLASPTCFNNPTVKLNEAASNRRYLSMPIDDSSMIILFLFGHIEFIPQTIIIMTNKNHVFFTLH
jgi:hypothetical protein